ncbi:hypothetical protein JTB14_009255 [Gonioctena quinquepunctata]|nr:hypothetical protein JTB14_009255 [Gonioctena quinquepunctata]
MIQIKKASLVKATREEIVLHCTQDNGENSTTNLDLGNEATGPASLKKLKLNGQAIHLTKFKEPVTETVKANGNESCNIGKRSIL